MKRTTLNIGGVPEHFNLPWHLLMESNFLETHGLSLHWEDQHGGTGQMTKALHQGELDIAILLTEGITKAILEGTKAKIVQVYVSSPLHWGIHVPFDSSIGSFEDLQGKKFAISRFGSGSHLMTYVKADQEGWNLNQLEFEVVNDLEGGLKSLENNNCQGFLWEKYTTHPYVAQERCKYVGEVVTPWPCFSIAVSEKCASENLHDVLLVVSKVLSIAQDLKQSNQAVSMISERYGIPESKIKQWFEITDWNYSNQMDVATFEKTVNYLRKLHLVTKDQAQDWETKLFIP